MTAQSNHRQSEFSVRRVAVADLRQEIEVSGLSYLEVARRLGWQRAPSQGGWDVPRLRRVLGLKAQNQGHGYGQKTRDAVNQRTAMAIRTALNGGPDA